MYKIYLLIFSLLPLFLFSQNEKVDFKLEKPKDGVRISPNVEFLFEGTPNYLKIETFGNLSIYDTTAMGEFYTEGEFIVLNVNSQVDKFETIGVYTQNNSTGEKSYCEKKYRIIPKPIAHISGILNDSALERNLILLAGKLDLKSKLRGIELQVDSFKMEIIQDGVLKNFKSNSNALTREMRVSIWDINEGNSILFYDICTSYTKGEMVSIAPLRIYTFISNERPIKMSTGGGMVIRR